MSSKPAQVWSLDMVFGALALITILLVVLSTNSAVDAQIALKEDRFYQESVAHTVAQNLVGTSGYWYLQAGNFSSVGLAARQNVLDAARVGAFFAADYNETKKALSAGKWDLRVRLYDKNGILLNAFGQAPASDSNVRIVSRLAVYKGQPALLKVEVWV